LSEVSFTVNGVPSIDIEVQSGDTVEMTVTESEPIEFEVLNAPGAPGNNGVGVPPGGTDGQQLTKVGTEDFSTEWRAPQFPVGVDKEVQFNDGGVIGAASDFKFDKNTKSVIIGIPDALPDNPLAIGRAVNGWLQANIQNTTEGPIASADWVATADNGSDLANYVDMGIDSSIYDSEDYPEYKPNDAYIQAEAPRLLINPNREGSQIVLLTGGSGPEHVRMTVDENGVTLPAATPITNRPEIFFGTGSPPSATGLADGTLFFKYTE
jgi:hypothetical protein